MEDQSSGGKLDKSSMDKNEQLLEDEGVKSQGEASEASIKGEFNWGAGEEYKGGPLILTAEGEEEGADYPPAWEEGQYESESLVSVVSSITEIEETEEERLARAERERLIDIIKLKMVARITLRKRNIFLHKKLAEHFKKRRLDHVLKEDPKGFELESKYRKRLYAFHEFKENQENEIRELFRNLSVLKNETEELEQELKETMSKFIQSLKDLSLTLVSSKTGKKLNEKLVDRLLKRLTSRNAEKGELRLKYVKMKNKIEEKEKQLKAMESFGNGLHIMDYEQMKIDNQNYSDKIEEKEEELAKLRVKTQGNIQNLAQVREKAYAIEGDIEYMESKYEDIEAEFSNTRERVGKAKKLRDAYREEFENLKRESGLLTRDLLLRDFENSMEERERVRDVLEELKMLMKEKKKEKSQLNLQYNKIQQLSKASGF